MSYVIQFTRYSSRRFRAQLSSLRTGLSYHILSNLSSTFFKVFQVFSMCVVLQAFGRSSHNSIILPQVFSFVKNFFQVFSNFFDSRLYLTALADSLDILPRQSTFVKHFLQKSAFFFVYYYYGHLSTFGRHFHHSRRDRPLLISARASPAS